MTLQAIISHSNVLANRETQFMPRKSSKSSKRGKKSNPGNFRLTFKNQAQGLAWAAFQQHDVLFILGPAGTGKTYLACAFAVEQVLKGEKERIILTRPIVESGESLGYLPGEFEDKVHPYMMPMYDCIEKLVGRDGPWRELINKSLEIAPIAYMRGRAQPLDSLLITPNGYKKMGDISVGDEVIGWEGKGVKVTGVYPQGEKEVYRVSFSDKTHVICSGDHLWYTATIHPHGGPFGVRTTHEILQSMDDKHCVPLVNGPVQFDNDSLLSLHEMQCYFAGLYLGCGRLSGEKIEFYLPSSDLRKHVEEQLSQSYHCANVSERGDTLLVDCKNLYKDLALCGVLNKDIEDCVMLSSVECRRHFIIGIMDSKGKPYYTGGCMLNLGSVRNKLAEKVLFIIRSLGWYAHMYHDCFSNWCFIDFYSHHNPFMFGLKRDKFTPSKKNYKTIEDITHVGKEECQCISVDCPNKLYLTDGFNLTHNTFDNAVCIFDEAQNATSTQLKLFLTRFGENSKIIITGDPTQSDVSDNPALKETVDKLVGVSGVGLVEFTKKQIVRHPLVSRILSKLD